MDFLSVQGMMTSLLQCLYGLFVHIVSLVPKKEYYFYYKIAIIASKAAQKEGTICGTSVLYGLKVHIVSGYFRY